MGWGGATHLKRKKITGPSTTRMNLKSIVIRKKPDIHKCILGVSIYVKL